VRPAGSRGGPRGLPEPLGYHPGVAGLTRSDVEHVAYLARLGMSPEELDRLQGQLNHILDQYMKLAELDTDAIAPTAQTIELENILRDDVVTPSLPAGPILANAPQRSGDFIVVPPILGGDGA
jgi:aspartyl-tRNA(Asn)/glutamyl-tRNA(Gln) amidotransferase subunit C